MLVDYLCEVAVSRIKRPVVPFNNPIAGLVRVLTRYAAEQILKEWESATNPMSVVGVGRDFRVMEQVSVRRLSFNVDLRRVFCSCIFHQFYAMPCRHLVFACLEAKVPVGKFWYEC